MNEGEAQEEPEAALSEAPYEALQGAPLPPRRGRNLALVVMAGCALLSLALLWSLRNEVRFAFQANTPVELGTFEKAPLEGQTGRYVRAKLGALRNLGSYHRIGEADAHYLSAVAAGPALRRWVEFRVPTDQSGPRFVAPTLVAGRLVAVGELGLRHRGVAGLLGGGAPSGWLLIDGESPASLGWVPALALLLATFALWNLACVIRILRRPRG